MGDGGAARAALGGDEADGAPDRGGAFGGVELGDGGHDLGGGGRQHHIFGDAGADQLAIEQHVVDMAQHDDAGGGIADFGEAPERGRDFLG